MGIKETRSRLETEMKVITALLIFVMYILTNYSYFTLSAFSTIYIKLVMLGFAFNS